MRCLIVVALLSVLGGSAQAAIVRYVGPHPITPVVMRGMCYIEGPHIHDYIPHKTILYVHAGDSWAFVGDPTEYEVEVPRFKYYGHHPVFWASVGPGPAGEICYISGPHHHWYAPPPELRFVTKGGVYWYVGGMPRGYVRRWHRHSPIDDYYGGVHFVVARPVVTIEPPEGYVGFYFGPGYGRHYRGGVYGGYYGPRVGVQVEAPPPPSVNITVGGGGWVGGGGYVGPGPGGPPPHAPAWGRRGGPPGHVGGPPGHMGGPPPGHGGRPPGHGGGHGGGHGRRH